MFNIYIIITIINYIYIYNIIYYTIATYQYRCRVVEMQHPTNFTGEVVK